MLSPGAARSFVAAAAGSRQPLRHLIAEKAQPPPFDAPATNDIDSWALGVRKLASRSGRSPGIYSQLRPAPAPSPARPETEGSPLHDEAPQPTAAAGCAAAWCPRCRCCYKHEAEVRSASRR